MKILTHASSLRRAIPALLACAVVFTWLCGAPPALAKPRPPGPPWPEIGQIYHQGFDQPLYGPTNQVIDSSIWVESWSGYALNRQQGTVVTPWIVPILATNGTRLIDPARGALRLWYMPTWSSAATGQGAGPGNAARLLTLVSTNSSASAVWWSLEVAQDGNTLGLLCQNANGAAVCLSAPISFQAGTWHCLAVGYTETNSAMFMDGQQVAAGDGLTAVPTEALPFTSLVIGSSLAGNEVAAGQIEEFSAFTGGKRFHQMLGQEFGLSTDWELAAYYTNNVSVAALGPISEAEELAREQRMAAARAARLAAQETMATSALSGTAGPLDGGGVQPMDLYDPSQGFWLTAPQVVQGTNLFLTLVNGDTNISYDIYYTPSLAPTDWRILATGHIAQATFTVPMIDGIGFFKGGVGGDWDLDGIPNWMDANPTNAAIGALRITIDNPVTGTLLQ
jgi:hypothetical protein